MINRNELIRTIEELENSPQSYQNCEKLATFYTIYDHLYKQPDPEPYARASHETIIGQYGDSEFLQAVEGTEASEAWAIINELMEILKRLQPKIYESVLNRLKK